jgi:hypothetical protein
VAKGLAVRIPAIMRESNTTRFPVNQPPLANLG